MSVPPELAGAAAELVVLAVVLAVVAIGLGIEAWSERRERRRWALEIREAKRASEREGGLPPHERCVCDECAAWRAVPSNLAKLQARQ